VLHSVSASWYISLNDRPLHPIARLTIPTGAWRTIERVDLVGLLCRNLRRLHAPVRHSHWCADPLCRPKRVLDAAVSSTPCRRITENEKVRDYNERGAFNIDWPLRCLLPACCCNRCCSGCGCDDAGRPPSELCVPQDVDMRLLMQVAASSPCGVEYRMKWAPQWALYDTCQIERMKVVVTVNASVARGQIVHGFSLARHEYTRNQHAPRELSHQNYIPDCLRSNLSILFGGEAV
jgi:hypothetical protein